MQEWEDTEVVRLTRCRLCGICAILFFSGNHNAPRGQMDTIPMMCSPESEGDRTKLLPTTANTYSSSEKGISILKLWVTLL